MFYYKTHSCQCSGLVFLHSNLWGEICFWVGQLCVRCVLRSQPIVVISNKVRSAFYQLCVLFSLKTQMATAKVPLIWGFSAPYNMDTAHFMSCHSEIFSSSFSLSRQMLWFLLWCDVLLSYLFIYFFPSGGTEYSYSMLCRPDIG